MWGQTFLASHPIIRTNPVTGWKSLYSVLKQVQKINELSEQESVGLGISGSVG